MLQELIKKDSCQSFSRESHKGDSLVISTLICHPFSYRSIELCQLFSVHRLFKEFIPFPVQIIHELTLIFINLAVIQNYSMNGLCKYGYCFECLLFITHYSCCVIDHLSHRILFLLLEWMTPNIHKQLSRWPHKHFLFCQKCKFLHEFAMLFFC